MRRALPLLLALTLSAATGKVQFLGSAIDSGNIYLTNTSALAYDGDYSTSWQAATTGQWMGMDMGAAVTLSRYLIAPRTDNNECGNGTSCWDRGGGANVFEASNDATFVSGTVTLDTLAKFPFISQLMMNSRPVTPVSTYRYYRVRSPSGDGDIAELAFIGNAQNGVNAKPVAPTVSPWGGVYTTGSATVTLASETTSAALRYTVDGSTPTCSSTLYSAPFDLSVGTSTVLKAIACDATLSTTSSSVSTATFRLHDFVDGVTWYEPTAGVANTNASGDIVGPVGGRFYWFGQWMLAGKCNQWGFTNDPCSTKGVWLYSSSDFTNWRFESQILDDGTSAGNAWRAVNRPHVIYNAGTSTYVLWAHCVGDDIQSINDNRACIATASTITGPWTWSNISYNPDGHGYKDCNLFVDDDGTGYTAYTDGTQSKIYVHQLASNYLSAAAGLSVIAVNAAREAPVLFKHGSTYYLIYSPNTIYGNATTPAYSTASTPLGTWTAQGDIANAGGGQPTFVFSYALPFRSGLVYGSDRWQIPVYNSTHQRGYLTFDGAGALTINLATSTWDIGALDRRKRFPMPGAPVIP
jgi:hypothetical protein